MNLRSKVEIARDIRAAEDDGDERKLSMLAAELAEVSEQRERAMARGLVLVLLDPIPQDARSRSARADAITEILKAFGGEL